MDILTPNTLEADVLFDDDMSFEASLSSCCCCCTAATSETVEETSEL